ncbi:hypothetical protein [Ochrobactrum sp. Marseille-Q0166]|nr:hypothetical protein [Ochrobactrum sp. Marseille-Q0166]
MRILHDTARNPRCAQVMQEDMKVHMVALNIQPGHPIVTIRAG